MAKSLTFKSRDFDSSVRVQDDLYGFVNNHYESKTKIPSDEIAVGTFSDLRKLSIEQVKALCEDNPGELYGKLYLSYMDKARIQRRGLAPVFRAIAKIEQVKTLKSLSKYAFILDREFFMHPFEAGVFNNPKDPDINILHFSQAGLGLPDESYYRLAEFEPIRNAYLTLITKIFRKFKIKVNPQIVLDFETNLAKLHLDLNQMRDVNLTTNLVKVSQLQEWCSNVNFVEGMQIWGLKSPETLVVNVATVDFFKRLDTLWNQENFSVIQAWNLFHAVHAISSWATDDVRKINFEFSKLLSGLKKMKPRWKGAVDLVNDALGDALAPEYVKRHFDSNKKQAMDALVENLLSAYHDSITNLDWLDDSTRKNALLKLKNMTVKIGYPQKYRNYQGLELGFDLIKNMKAIEKYEFQRELQKIGQPVDKDEWLMTPQTVNAYYHPMNNEIVFPAAILQPPFFNFEALDAENYGAIGAVIGHEIGHAFDDQGSEFDAKGNLKNWWSDDVRKRFQAKTKKLVAQFQDRETRFAPDKLRVDGQRTLGENIGDLGGLSIALQAYGKAVDGDFDKESTDEYSALQIFFFSFARSWRNKIRPESAETRLAVDVHAPTDLRSNVTPANLPEFYKAFNIKPSDQLYLPPGRRVSIW
ncbi:MAG: M13 family metallopeptidase [Bifidobacteriaceae bacterium]|jgi:putative endopeptidase|nr:M13 family metallopeptidase [Bifidobacteriaceae bacterium]